MYLYFSNNYLCPENRANGQTLIRVVDRTVLCACRANQLVTLDGVVAMKDPVKPYAYKRVVCPQPIVNRCCKPTKTISCKHGGVR